MSRVELLKISKPLICNDYVAKSFADDNKTETRRLPKHTFTIDNTKKLPIGYRGCRYTMEYFLSVFPRYKKGDTLWIREPAFVTNYISRFDSTKIDYQLKSDKTKQYRIDVPSRFFPNPKKWITGCHSVPNGCIKEMARMFYRVVDVRYEKLQDITFGDIVAEGFDLYSFLTKEEVKNYKNNNLLPDNTERAMFEWWKNTWDSTAPKGKKLNDNPLVEVYKLEKIVYDV